MGKVPINPKDKEILDSYLEYFDAYTKRDWEGMKKKFSSCLTMFGTGVDEVSLHCHDSLNFFSREFEQSPAPIEYSVKDIQVFKLDENIAYLMILMDIKFRIPDELVEFQNNRTTAIMVRNNGEWKLAHGHWSQPTEMQDVGESVPYKLLKERNKMLEEKVRERTKDYEEQNIVLQNLIKTKTNLLSIIAHDLRSPFNAFIGLTELMLYDLDKNLKKPEYFRTRLELIHERASYLYGVADTLLNWAWTQTDEIKVNKQVVKIKEIINRQSSTLDDLANAKVVKIAIDCGDELEITTDPEILGIIIRNFLSNAIKFSYRGGVVKVGAIIQQNQLLISITDSGVGMSEEKLNRILSFNNMESNPGTEQEKGIGLGLIICKELLNKLEGTLCVDSTQNKGTTIKILVPTQ